MQEIEITAHGAIGKDDAIEAMVRAGWPKSTAICTSVRIVGHVQILANDRELKILRDASEYRGTFKVQYIRDVFTGR